MANTKHFGALAAAAGALVAVALLVLMMLVWVNPQTAGAALPGANGRIAYVASDGTTVNDSEIFTIPASGGTDAIRTQVTHTTVTLSTPLLVQEVAHRPDMGEVERGAVRTRAG